MCFILYKQFLNYLFISRKVVSIYEVNSASKPKYRKLRDIELTMVVQSMQILGANADQLCVGFQSEFALYSLHEESAPIALLQPDRDQTLRFLAREPVNALAAIQIASDEYLLVFETLGVYVNTRGTRSRADEIMWPSRPLYVAYAEPHLLCFCERGIDVFHTRTADWLQILQFGRTRPLDRTGSLCLSSEAADATRLVHFRAATDPECVLSLATKSRSLVKSKYRKGSLNRGGVNADDTHLSLLSASTSSQPGVGGSGSPLNYSNSNASSSGSHGGQHEGNSRKSLISNPINFQHIQHMGPNDGKTFMHTDSPTPTSQVCADSRKNHY